MIENKKVLAVITARGGSKRIPNKNIKLLAGKPLIAYSIEAAKKSKLIDRLIVSTDSQEIAGIAEKHGAEVPFLRPKELAEDATPSALVLKQAVNWLAQKENYKAQIIVLIQPTTPLLESSDIDSVIQKLAEAKTNCSLSLVEANQRPERMFTFENGKLKSFLESKYSLARTQDLPKVLTVNGAVYAVKTEILMEKEEIIDINSATAVIMPPERSIDIDEPFDFKLAELLLKKKQEKES